MKLCMTGRFCEKKKKIPKKFWKMGQKQGSLNLLKDLVINFYYICSVMKTFVPEIWAKMFSANQPFQSTIFPKQINDFLHVDTSSHELKVGQNIFG